MVRLCWSSVCDTAITQMQDILCLDDKARMNTPSSVGANWKWRLEPLDDTLREIGEDNSAADRAGQMAERE